MSVELDSPQRPQREVVRSVAEVARGWRVDPRIPALVPGFDAPFFQAGLAGYSDGAMRLVARQHGCPFCVTEALLDRTLLNGGKGKNREDPDLIADAAAANAAAAELASESCGTGEVEENRIAGVEDHPIAGQIMGTLPGEMAEAGAMLADMGYDMVDVNLACPVKKIKSRNRGGHFLAHAEDAIDVLRAVREGVPASVPCTVKLRRAYDDSPEMARNFERIFDAAYDLGYAWATVHCRTVEQKYLGPSRWSFLRELMSRHRDRVVFGSGDVWTVNDIFEMLEYCGVTGVSVARGCIGNPWIFRQARELMAGRTALAPTLSEQRAVLLEHLRLAKVLHGEMAASRRMRKFGIKFAVHHADAEATKADFIKCTTLAQWGEVVERRYGVM
ncbi:MAG: tRNA-dihydrouridine synthase family protein [Planctomycetota bacterium]|nr:tRNA-dihydrouridine synthase family protein [Planctomycetota bacterium]MDA1106592.1 tRNA-dihydrouridine synthase family protein [Planctomycetota bacterium]